ncbi:MerR family transcriptional regulator [Levilactobacillus brevis]|uniref:MerR family transcriptional regulator n=2 Tax=Levilactobacillus brevis TaxID=1580 RepID=A0A0C1PTQ2_LEVBR|nr:MerR family transcriptional regulator [Levilactobacillus brevis]ANN49710.1 transcriptional regulator [Levilactobacillus brevis]ARN93207.1 MerR family transcriptional regulator [Levilactobacillus brevis]ARN95828.1 MerR family transcriptional regulator [Levilactobacillus brevis]ATU70996.1 MerR family transcriptional regulator [Levilactobacillus brevis]ERK41090.1 transcriptional regulator, MerR family [Levilactobacillus brevis ATCC 14869 = DSM 20054]
MAEFTNEMRKFFDIQRLVFRIGELSAMTDVSARQLRYWEKKGLIASQAREDGQQARVYTFKTFVQVSMIKYFLDEGYTLEAASHQARSRQDRMKYIHRFISSGLQGFATVDGQMAINLGAFDADQTLMAILPESGPTQYRLFPNDEAQRLTQAAPN